MRVKIDCKYLSNKGNGSKCKIGPHDGKKMPDCIFLKNGIPEKMDFNAKRLYLNNLLLACQRMHRKQGDLKYFLDEICPQIEQKLEQMFQKFSP